MTMSPSSGAGEPRPASRLPALWFRTLLSSGSLGPGKLSLIRLIGETGSVSAAAKRLRMSHARSVKLVAEINALGPHPLILTRSGGAAGGGASLTDVGCELIKLYDQLEAVVGRAAAPHLLALEALLAAGNGPVRPGPPT